MGEIPQMRFFRLSDSGVQCGEDGLFVGSVAILHRSPGTGGGETWAVRPSDELERDLGACYGLPIDIAAKRERLAGVARALQRGDLALAKIAALLLRFPAPPLLAKDAPERGSLELAARLFESDLLTGAWDPSKHPRTGTAPNPGRFAVNPDKGELTAPNKPAEESSESEEQTPSYRKLARPLIREAAKAVVKTWSLGAWSSPILKAIEIAATILDPTALNSDEQRVLDGLRASLDPPKTLDELQTEPTENELGYDCHHIVGQNGANVAKSSVEEKIEKFGWAAIDDPSNLVWIPRLKHESITAYYNSIDEDDPQKRVRWRVVGEMDFNGQREAGLAALRKFGVLQ